MKKISKRKKAGFLILILTYVYLIYFTLSTSFMLNHNLETEKVYVMPLISSNMLIFSLIMLFLSTVLIIPENNKSTLGEITKDYFSKLKKRRNAHVLIVLILEIILITMQFY